jgi:iron complex outermembrane recepter protein
MMYASVTKGFKPGGYNSFSLANGLPTVFNEEKVLSYEIGAKGSFWNGRVQSSIAAYYYDYEDLQFAVF